MNVAADHLLARAFLESHPADTAPILERFAAAEAAQLVATLTAEAAAEVVGRMMPLAGAAILDALDTEPAAAIVDGQPLDTAAALLRRVSPETQTRILDALPPPVAEPLQRLLRYPDRTAGALMDPRALTLSPDITAAEALARMRSTPRHVLSYLYVVDREHRLVGVLSVRELLLATPRALVSGLMRTDVARLSALADRDAILAHPAWDDVHALPVVEDQAIFVGVLRHKTARGLARASDARPLADASVGALVSLGEVWWRGSATVLAELASLALASTRKDQT